MNRIIETDDIGSPELAPYFSLTEAQLKSKSDPSRALFVAEGSKVIATAAASGYEAVSILTQRRYLLGAARQALEAFPDAPVYILPPELFKRLTGYSLTRGALCAVKRKPQPPLEMILAGARRVALLDGIADSTNMGAIFRSAAALGMDAVICASSCCDPLLRRSLRVSMGTVLQIPWCFVPDISRVKNAGFVLAAMALKPGALRPDDPRLKEIPRLAVVLGSEGWGLGEETLALCDHTVCIPMKRGVDSLNVAAASAVAFWELMKNEKGADR